MVNFCPGSSISQSQLFTLKRTSFYINRLNNLRPICCVVANSKSPNYPRSILYPLGSMQDTNILIYIVRHDLRVGDNPILHRLASSADHGFTHFLPVHIIPPYQIEVSGFLKDGETSPFPEARSEVARFWRCGPHRARFIAQSVWNMKENLINLGNDLTIRIGRPEEVLKGLIEGLRENQQKVSAVWMIGEEGYEEERDEKRLAETCSTLGVDLQVWVDEKYFIDE